jgi:excisionase family DNA binding protein
MNDRVILPIAGVGVLALDREVFEAALVAGSELRAANRPAQAVRDEPLLDADQLAAVLSVPVSWIELAARQGRIPSLEFGRWRRFRRSEVEAAVVRERERERA